MFTNQGRAELSRSTKPGDHKPTTHDLSLESLRSTNPLNVGLLTGALLAAPGCGGKAPNGHHHQNPQDPGIDSLQSNQSASVLSGTERLLADADSLGFRVSNLPALYLEGKPVINPGIPISFFNGDDVLLQLTSPFVQWARQHDRSMTSEPATGNIESIELCLSERSKVLSAALGAYANQAPDSPIEPGAKIAADGLLLVAQSVNQGLEYLRNYRKLVANSDSLSSSSAASSDSSRTASEASPQNALAEHLGNAEDALKTATLRWQQLQLDLDRFREASVYFTPFRLLQAGLSKEIAPLPTNAEVLEQLSEVPEALRKDFAFVSVGENTILLRYFPPPSITIANCGTVDNIAREAPRKVREGDHSRWLMVS